MEIALTRSANKIAVSGFLGQETFRRLLANIHVAIEEKGYSQIVLDFSACSAAFPGGMLPVCAFCLEKQSHGVAFKLTLPSDARLRKLFLDTNWAYLIDPMQSETDFRGYLQVPATQFRDFSEQHNLVNRVVVALLKSVQGFSRSDFEALEWCISEITDNVLAHSQSKIGGLLQFSNRSTKRRLEFTCCDAGAGVPATLRPAFPNVKNEFDLLDQAIKEGVTRDALIGQGNGLFGSSEVCVGSGGFFGLQSGHSALWKSPNSLK